MRASDTPAFRGLLRRFRRDRKGIAAVEFAMILPLMLLMWLGTVEVGQVISVQRKSKLVSRTLADLTARATTINNAEMTNILNATNAVIYPFSPTPLSMRVTSVKLNGSSQTQVTWGDKRGDYTAYAPGQIVSIPSGVLTLANQTVIMAEVKYRYKPAVGWLLVGQDYTVNERTFMVPRLVGEISRTAS